jgi:glycosyltransferase involved in cell wall biosynthesis
VTVFVLPGDVADATVSSGGNGYDLRMCEALGPEVHAVEGAWPNPGQDARDRLAATLRDLADDTTVLLDGLVACGVPEIIVPQAGRLRIAVLVHMPLADETGRDADLIADLDDRERRTLRAVSAVIVTSSWSAQRLIRHHGLPADRVHVAPPGVDVAPVADGGGARLVCVAAVTPHKGQDVLAQALAEIKDLPWSCECVGPLVRDPEFAARLRGLIGEYGLTERMILTGPRTGPDLAATYAAADLVVLPSHGETYGMVITESLARGVPVLATAVNAGPDTLGQAPDGSVPGMLVSPGDPVELAAALRRFLTEPDFRQRLKESALARRTTLTGWDTTARLLGQVLERLERGPKCAASAR